MRGVAHGMSGASGVRSTFVRGRAAATRSPVPERESSTKTISVPATQYRSIESSVSATNSGLQFGPIGINICYDVECPVVARRQAEAGARIILAPCCCDSLRGYYRVRVGARARALENQAYVVQSPAIGTANWLAEFDRLVGFAAIYGPPDLGPRESGVLAQGTRAHPEWNYADLDLGAIDRIRGDAGMANAREWTAHMEIGAAAQGEFVKVPA